MTGYPILIGNAISEQRAAPFFVDISYNDYVYESEVLVNLKNKLKVDEMPIKCVYGDEKSYVHFRHVIHYVMFTFRLLLCRIIREDLKFEKILCFWSVSYFSFDNLDRPHQMWDVITMQNIWLILLAVSIPICSGYAL